MLPMPLTSVWSSMARLIPVLPTFQRGEELGIIEGRVERVAGDVCDLARHGCGVGAVPAGGAVRRRQQVIDRHRAEDALIDEVQAQRAMPGMLDVESDAGEAVVGLIAVAQQHLAAHAEVDDERAGAVGIAQRSRDASADEAASSVVGSGASGSHRNLPRRTAPRMLRPSSRSMKSSLGPA